MFIQLRTNHFFFNSKKLQTSKEYFVVHENDMQSKFQYQEMESCWTLVTLAHLTMTCSAFVYNDRVAMWLTKKA